MFKTFLVIFLFVVSLCANDSSLESENPKYCENNIYLTKYLDSLESSSENSSNSSKIDIEIVKLLIDKQEKLSEKERNNLKFYSDFINNGYIYNERFIYLVGSILILIGFLIFIIAFVLGIWQRNKINTFEKEFSLLKKSNKEIIKNMNSSKDELNSEFNQFKKSIVELDSYNAKIQDTLEKVNNLEEQYMLHIQNLKEDHEKNNLDTNKNTNIKNDDIEKGIDENISSEINPFKKKG
jgi:hypothetical protein